MTPRDLWRDVRASWAPALLAFLVVLGLLVANAVTAPKSYRTSATVSVQPKAGRTADALAFGSQGLQLLVPIFKARAESDAVREAVRSDVTGAADADFSATADITPASGLVTVTVTTPQRALAIPLARAYVDELTSFPNTADIPVAIASVQPPLAVVTASSRAKLVTGLAEGLVLGLIAAALLALLLGRRRRARDLVTRLPAELGAPVLATVPLRTRGAGVLDDDLSPLVARLRPRIDSGALSSLTFLSSRSGVGRTTLALQTARALVQSGVPVLLVDADLENPRVQSLVGELPVGAQQRTSRSEVVAALPASRTAFGDLWLLDAAGLQEHAAKLGAAADRSWAAVIGSIPDVLAQARSAGLFVVVDVPASGRGDVSGPAGRAEADAVAAAVSGSVVVVDARRRAKAVEEAAGEVSAADAVGASVLGVVVNRAGRST